MCRRFARGVTCVLLARDRMSCSEDGRKSTYPLALARYLALVEALGLSNFAVGYGFGDRRIDRWRHRNG